MWNAWPLLTLTFQCWLLLFILGKGIDSLSSRRLSTWLNRHHITWALGIFLYQHQFMTTENTSERNEFRSRSQQARGSRQTRRLERSLFQAIRLGFELGAYLTLMIGCLWLGWLLFSCLQWMRVGSQHALAWAPFTPVSVGRSSMRTVEKRSAAARMPNLKPSVKRVGTQGSMRQASPDRDRALEKWPPDEVVSSFVRRDDQVVHWASETALRNFGDKQIESCATSLRSLNRPMQRLVVQRRALPWQTGSRSLGYVQKHLQSACRSVHPHDLVFLVIAIGLSVFIHELGHALAATLEAVPITHLGLFLVACFPGAYIRLHPGVLARLGPRRQLRIYAAGCVQSLIAAFVALALLNLLPLLAQLAGFAFADDGQGAVVTWVRPESLWHPIIEPESRLVALDGRRIRFAHEVSPWQANRALAKEDSFTDSRNQASLVSAEQDLAPSFAKELVATDCVLIRPSAQWHYLVFERPRWTLSRDTQQTEQPKAVARLDTDPALTSTRQVLWFDEPLECVLRDIRLSDYQRQAREPLIERCVLHGVEKLLAYLFLVSLGLGLVNIVPAAGLDGAHMLRLFVEILIQKLGQRYQAGAHVLRLTVRALLILHTLLLAGLWLMAVFTQQLEPLVTM